MSDKFLSKDGLTYFWSQLKTKFASKPDVGTVQSPSAVSVPNATWTSVLSVDLTKNHLYEIDVVVEIASNTSGYRKLRLCLGGTDAGIIAHDQQRALNTGSQPTVLRVHNYFKPGSTNKTLTAEVYHNAGNSTNLSVTPRYQLVDWG